MEIARAYLKAFPPGEQGSQGKREAVETAAAWLASHLDLAAPIGSLLTGMAADACLIGAASAAALTDGTDVDTGGWQPGDTGAASDRVNALGLGGTFSGVTAMAGQRAQDVAGGYLTGLARCLVDAAQSGSGIAGTALSLTAYLASPANAHTAVLGLLAVGIGAAALALYLKVKVQRVRWVTDGPDACPACAANAKGSPYRIENAPTVPEHPHCRCSVVPD